MVNDTPPTPPTPATPSSATLSISQLREKLKAFGVSYEHCIEKAELVKLLRRAEFKAGRVEFKPTHKWQTVESFHLCPMGLQYEMDMKSGTTFARLSEAGTGRTPCNSVPTTPPSKVGTPSKVGMTPPSNGATPPSRWSKQSQFSENGSKLAFDGTYTTRSSPLNVAASIRTPLSRSSAVPASSNLCFTPLKQPVTGGSTYKRGSTSVQALTPTQVTRRKQPDVARALFSSEPDLVGPNHGYRLMSASSNHLPLTSQARMQSEPDLTRGSRKRVLQRSSMPAASAVHPEHGRTQPPVPSAPSQSAVPLDRTGATQPVVRDTSLYDELPFEDKDVTERRRRRRLQNTNGVHAESPLNSSKKMADTRKRRRASYVGETAEDIPYLAPLHPEAPLRPEVPLEPGDCKRQKLDAPDAGTQPMGPPALPRNAKRSDVRTDRVTVEGKRRTPEEVPKVSEKRGKSNSPPCDQKTEHVTPDQPDHVQNANPVASVGRGESDDEWPTSGEQEATRPSSEKARRRLSVDEASGRAGKKEGEECKESERRPPSAESAGERSKDRKEEQLRRGEKERRSRSRAAKGRARRNRSGGEERLRRSRSAKGSEEGRRNRTREEGGRRRSRAEGDRRRSRTVERERRSSSAEERETRGRRDTRRMERRVSRTVAKERPRSERSVENERRGYSRRRQDGRRECRRSDRDRREHRRSKDRKYRERRRSSRERQRRRSTSGSDVGRDRQSGKRDVLPSTEAPFDSYI